MNKNIRIGGTVAKKEDSLQRSKKSLTTLAEIIGPRALDMLAPGAGVAFDLSKLSFEHAREYMRERTKQRIEDFHIKLLEGCKDKEELDELLEKDFSLEDYYGILSAVTQDEEDDKIDIYARILKGILNGKIDKKYKTHVIKSAREMSVRAFELMRTLHIASKVLLEGENTIADQIRNILDSADPLQTHATQTLLRFGYIATEPVLKHQPLLDMVINAIYDESELAPEAIGRQKWGSKAHVALIATDLANKHVDNIIKQLDKLDINLSPITPKGFPKLMKQRAIAGASRGAARPLMCLVCVDGKSEKHPDMEELFLTNTNFRNQHPVIITLPGASARIFEGQGYDTFDMARDFDVKLNLIHDMVKNKLNA